jgi:hypothetical protein
MDFLISIREFLVTYGVWTILLLAIAKTFTGIALSVERGTFKWHKLGTTLKEGDFVKVVVFAVLSFIAVPAFTGSDVNDNNFIAPMALYLTTDLTAGLLRNLGELFPSIYAKMPESIRE